MTLPSRDNLIAGKTFTLTATPTISSGSAYADGDAVGGKLTFADAVLPERGATIQSITVVDLDSQDATLKLVLFDQDFTAETDNAAFDPSDADLANCIGWVEIAEADYQAFSDNSVASVNSIGKAFTLDGVGTSLYGQLITTGTPTYASTSSLTIKLHILQD